MVVLAEGLMRLGSSCWPGLLSSGAQRSTSKEAHSSLQVVPYPVSLSMGCHHDMAAGFPH